MEKPQPVNFARGLRRRQTDTEEMLWAKLRNRQLDGVKFRRQQSLGSYIVDFVSFDEKLVIEVDGGQHNELPAIEKDDQRTRWLEGEGFHVLRFWNNDLLENVDGVLMRIKQFLETRSHPHLPSPIEGEGNS